MTLESIPDNGCVWNTAMIKVSFSYDFPWQPSSYCSRNSNLIHKLYTVSTCVIHKLAGQDLLRVLFSKVILISSVRVP